MGGELLTMSKWKVDNTEEGREEDMGRIRNTLIVNQRVGRG